MKTKKCKMCNNDFSYVQRKKGSSKRFCDKCARKRNAASKRRWYHRNPDSGILWEHENREKLRIQMQIRDKTRTKKLRILRILKR